MAQAWGADGGGAKAGSNHSFMVSKTWAFCLKFERNHHERVKDTMSYETEDHLVVGRLWRAGLRAGGQQEGGPDKLDMVVS